MADLAIVASEVAATPQDYTLPGAQEILLKAVGCTINGTSAAGTFLPTLQMIDPSGHVMWTAVNASEPIAAGGSALVSWFPGGGINQVSPTSGGGSGGGGAGITDLTSAASTIAVTNPTGPSTNVDLPPSGVVAGTYGDGSHISQIQVSSDGIITSASSVGVSGTVGGLVNLFDQTLGASAATIDTGAGGIPSGYSGLMIYALARADGAFFSGSLDFVINNDTAANYDQLVTDNSAGVISGATAVGVNNGKICEMSGASIGANIFTSATVWIPAYTDTTAFKECSAFGGFADPSGHGEMVNCMTTWHSTAAITRFAIKSGIGNLIAGSRLTIWGVR